ncbi:leucine--tRNA ligase [Glycomyces algeriensis]|uniref:Leucine--tRNA ligase n=1 Tax=Glycomyces algeriensis TaxID=256037 RepID=A0A9W6GAF2_9ACTN|nr:leucine--tRNA ligase [Glycomyces algeriensis]MDA1366749.1 leucine--tRNA ligase [Glycomyces algeriensis]MDR7351636.1 leucyl-tRNA synthetase [Glycomyces algeriensis]GLI44359.1 leucine--tRNA ligase [Glycomyces algeriensis]
MTEPAHRYDAELANRIEPRWQERWDAEQTFRAPNPTGDLAEPGHPRAGAPKKFVMDMFPYPSGAGLHVGHPLGYIATDAYSRYLRMAGYNVLHPLGFDAFGLPTEQYAIATGRQPAEITAENIERYREQLRILGMGYDKRREFATTDPDYFKWTQWIFLQIFNSWYDTEADRARPIDELVAAFESGERETPDGRPWSELGAVERRAVIDGHRLAYVTEAPVNWCPGLGTVLSNEEVTSEGRSERGNFPVYTRTLKQWMMRITAYADRLLGDLDGLDWTESLKSMQRNWIGKSIGAYVDFGTYAGDIRVFTTRPDTLFGATYMVLAPEHPLVESLTAESWPAGVPDSWTGGHDTPAGAIAAYRAQAAAKTDVERQADAKEKTGVFTGGYATNPVNGENVPVFIADYVLAGYGTGAIMAVPAHDERDFAFAQAFGIPIVQVVAGEGAWDRESAFTADGTAVNSGFLDGLRVAEAKARMIEWLAEHGRGEGATTFRLRDWLFSRQRYWGEPFPIVYDETGLPVALSEEHLPVELPQLDDFSPKTFDPEDADSAPEPPLGRAKDWVEVELDLGDGPKTYTRELNTMPNWAGSSWYELRYTDPKSAAKLTEPANESYWMGPQDAEDVGGVDLYIGGVEHAVLHLLYARFWQKVLFDLGHVSSREPFRRLFNQGYIQAYAYTDDRGVYVPAEEVEEVDGEYFHNGQKVNREYGKIGKSLKNVVTPDGICAEYGADTFRVYEMSMGPLAESKPWETRAIVGSQRFLQRLWRNIVDEETGEVTVGDEAPEPATMRELHKAIAGVREDYEHLRMNTAVAKLITLNNHLTGLNPVPREAAEALVAMVAPVAPHIAEELWERLGHEGGIAYVDFPVADERHLVEDTVTYPVQINGKVRGRIEVAAGADEEAVKAAALAEEKVAANLAGKDVKKVIVVAGKMVSIVAK